MKELTLLIMERLKTGSIPDLLKDYLQQDDPDTELFLMQGERLVDLQLSAISIVLANRLIAAGIRTAQDLSRYSSRHGIALLSSRTGITRRWLSMLMNPEIEERGGTGQKITVLLVDDHPVYRAGLRRELDSTDDIEVVGEAITGAEALIKTQRLQPEIVLLDINLPELSGLEVTGILKSRQTDTKIILLTGYDDETQAMQAFRRGASGFISKNAEPAQIEEAVRQVAKGRYVYEEQVFDTKEVQSWFSEMARSINTLNDQEMAVLELLMRGIPARELALRARLDPRTLSSYLTSICVRLKVNDLDEAIAYAKLHGWLRLKSGAGAKISDKLLDEKLREFA